MNFKSVPSLPVGIVLFHVPEPNAALDSPLNSSLDQPLDAIVGPVFDRLLRLRRGDRSTWLVEVCKSVARFPHLARFDRKRLLRQIVLSDAANRIVFRFGNCFPELAKQLTKVYRIEDASGALQSVRPGQPVLIALMHFGPIHHAVAVSLRLFPDRTLYVLQAGGETGSIVSKYLNDIGSVPIVTDRAALRTLEIAFERCPASAAIVAFDHLDGRLRYAVPFLGGQLAVPGGLAYIADRLDAVVVPCRLNFTLKGIRFIVDRQVSIDRTIASHDERRAEFVRRMFALLEEHVTAAPHRWTEWANCRGAEAVTHFESMSGEASTATG